MFEVSIRINGSLLYHIYGHRKTDKVVVNDYYYEIHSMGENKSQSGEVYHLYDEGLLKLVKLVLEDYEVKYTKISKGRSKSKQI